MKRKAIYNMVTSIFSKCALMVMGFVMPRLFIFNYGSDINGTLNTISQVFLYVALLEAGIGEAARNALYKPIAMKDKTRICEVLSASRIYYRKITVYYAIAVIILSMILPVTFKTSLSFGTVALIVLIEGMIGVFRFWFLENSVVLLLAEGKQYVTTNINFVNQMIMYIAKIIMIYLTANIILIETCSFAISLFQIIIYHIYIKKNYPWIRYLKDVSEIKEFCDRKFFLLNQLAWTIFSSTDTIIISIILGTEYASVYVVYNLVYSGLQSLMNNIYEGLTYILGQMFHLNKKIYVYYHDMFDLVFITIMSILMSCCSVLMIPFIKLYINNMGDIEYIYYILPLEFGLVNLLSWCRYVSGYVCCIGGFANKTAKLSIVEAIINIILSVIMSFELGIYGILLATIIALVYKMIGLVKLANDEVLHRGTIQTFRKIAINVIMYICVSILFILNPLEIIGITDFCVTALITLFCISIIYIIVNFFCERKLIIDIYKYYKSRKIICS